VKVVYFSKSSVARFRLLLLRDIILSVVLVGIYFLIKDIWNYYSFQLIISEDGVMLKQGIIVTKTKEIPFNNLNFVSVSQGVLGKMLNFGNLEIATGGDDPDIIFNHIHDPHRVKEIIQNQLN
jgi:uncharacterized membrane protein YdbT with pleckstrin-like domain